MEWLVALLLSWQPLAADLRPVIELAQLDRVRAESYAAGDPGMLDRVYVEGSTAKKVDAATIRAYRDRGARVMGAKLQVLTWHIEEQSVDAVTLDIVDQLAPSEVVWDDGQRTSLPHDQPTHRTVTLVLTDAGWRLG